MPVYEMYAKKQARTADHTLPCFAMNFSDNTASRSNGAVSTSRYGTKYVEQNQDYPRNFAAKYAV